MFAVPGWSLSADTLKAETSKKAAPVSTPGESGPSTKGTGANATGLFAAPPAKKRKREKSENANNSTGPQVTTANVADLWERVIEGREPAKRDDKKAKRQKKDKKGKDSNGKDNKSGEGESGETQTPEVKPVAASVATPTKATSKEKPAKEKPAKKAAVKVQAVETTPKPAIEAATPKSTPKATPKATQATPQPVEKPALKPVQLVSTKKEKPAAPAKAAAEKQATPQQSKSEKTTTPKAVDAKPQPDKNKNKKPAAAEQPAAPAKPVSALAALLPPAAPKLTPLQASMRAKLVSARFRHLNETLYTSPSEEALRLFGESPDMFQAYHEGFRQQVSVWPENPVDGYVAEVHRRAGKGDKGGKGGRGGRGGRGGGRGGRGLYHAQRDPTDTLPRTRGLCRLADIGCGDARLATSLAPDAKTIRIEVLSFDLHADRSNPYITAAADASALPITTGTVDVAVFCLALMGTNWLTFIEEAYRILRWKGELWVAEIKSRFAGSGELRARIKQKLKQQPVSHSVGFRRKNGIKGGKKGQDEEDPDVVAAAMAEVDGDDDNTGATDVTAFVHALRRRGFVLDEIAGAEDGNDGNDGKGSKTGGKAPAVDLSNKMFVRMRFIKAAPALVGKEEVMEALAAMHGNKDTSKRPKLKYHDDDEKKNADPMDDPALEARILKPCVYKLR